MTYTLSPEQARSVTDVDIAFGGDHLLPAWEQIPDEFRKGNDYTRLAEAIFFGQPLPDWEMAIRDGFTPELLNRVVRAHLGSFGPKHQHKIAGVGLMIARMCTLSTPAAEEAPAHGG